jgi:Ca2+-binding RTX toxin-like protein
MKYTTKGLGDLHKFTDGDNADINKPSNNTAYYTLASTINDVTPAVQAAPVTSSLQTTVSTTQTASAANSLQNMVGLSQLIYSNGSLIKKGELPGLNALVKVNGTIYTVIDEESDASGYQGLTLFDTSSKTIIVVNKGTQTIQNWATDAVMAFTATNNQWQGAYALGSRVAALAAANGATSIYATGHSLGGTLTQMQAAYFGWQGYTFNAYGADEVYTQLGLTINPNAHITNYRTMFDLVSDASTHIGDPIKTIETPQDVALLSSFYDLINPSQSLAAEFLATIGEDHFISNFYGASDPAGSLLGGGDNVFSLAQGFALGQPPPQVLAIAEDIVSSMAELIHLGLEVIPGVGPFQSGNLTFQQSAEEVMQFINHEPVSGIKTVIPSDPSLLSHALDPAIANNAYRASLASLSPAVLQGLDPTSFVNASLWVPGQTTGLTKDYLIAKNGMVQAMITLAGAGQLGGTITTSNKDTYVYTDFGRSPSPMYTLTGSGGSTYNVVFADNNGDALAVAAGVKAELFGGSGNDTLYGGMVGSTLEGGAGNDVYVIDGTGTDVDYVLDTDGQGSIEWKSADGSIKTLTGGADQLGTAFWKSADGSITYFEDLAADGSTELEITSQNKVVYIDDFTNGEFGITLDSGPVTIPTTNNLSGFGTTTYSDHVEYQDLSGSGGGDSMDGVNTTGGNYNILEGEGNAGYLYAGNGNNDVFAVDLRYSPVRGVFSNPISVVIQGGSGDQLLVGMGEDGSQGNGNETIIGGDMGSDATAWTTIDGGGAFVNALLVGGSQNSLIFGGIGTDTIMAGAAVSGSGKPDPTTIAIAGMSFWASSSEGAQGGGSVTVTGEPEVSVPAFSDPANFQIDIALNQLDGSYAAPFGLLGSALDSGIDDNGGWNVPGKPGWTLPGSLLIGGSGIDFLIGNSGNDTLIGGAPSHPTAGVIDEVLAGGGGANLIYGGSGTELIFADLSPGGSANWANLNPSDADTIYGGTGTEYIYGSGGNDVIRGGSGDYTIYTGNGNTYVEAGSGNTIIHCGSGNDTIVAGSGTDSITTGDGNSLVEVRGGQSTITTGAGSDTIEAAGGDALITEAGGATTLVAGPNSGSDTVQLGAGSTTLRLQGGLTESTVIMRDVNGDLVLSDDGFDTDITVDGYFVRGGDVSVQFQDGTTWGAAQITAASMAPRMDGGNDTLVGSNGNDGITAGYGDTLIIGVSGNNTLVGGAGDDTIQGGTGADTIEGGSGTTQVFGGNGQETYVFNVGDGSDTIVENRVTLGTDVLQLGEGIKLSDVTFATLGGSNDLLIQFGAATDSTVVVRGFLHGSGNGGHQLGAISFADGTTLTAAQVQAIAANVYVSDNGNDLIQGGSGNSTIYGGSGHDTLIGGSATNLIVGGSGTELIEGGSGSNTLIGGAGNDTLIAGPNGDMIDTGTGFALVETGAGNDTIDTTGGVDTLQPSNGNDIYEFGLGSGQDTLKSYAYSPAKAGADTLLIGAGLSAGDLTFTRIGISDDGHDDLVVGIKGTKDSFTIDGYFSYQNLAADSVPLTLHFQDGSALTFNQVEAFADAQADWNGAVSSFDPSGNSSVPQSGHFARGDGKLALNSSQNLSADEVANGYVSDLHLDQGIRPQDVVLTADGDSVVLTIKGTSDSMYIPGLLNASVDGYALTAIDFNDGTEWSLPTALQHVSYGSGVLSAAGQVVNATTANELVTAAGPNDTINAIAGDTIGFGYGDGQTVLNMAPVASGINSGPSTILLGAGILPSDVSIGLSDFGIVLSLKSTGERLAIDGELWDTWDHAVDQVEFANGTVWDTNNIQAMIDTDSPVALADNGEAVELSSIIKTLPADTNVLFGGGGGTTLEPGMGNAFIVLDDGYGGKGTGSGTTINYALSDGNVTISGAGSRAAVIQFAAGLTANDIEFSSTFDYSQYSDSYGNTFASDGEGAGNLLLTIKSTGKKISIPFTIYLDSSGQPTVSSAITSFTFQDGESFDPAKLIAGGSVNITAIPGVVVGTRGAETLMGAAGDTIDAAIGNTVVLGSNQIIARDGSALADQTALPGEETTYLFNSATNGDTLSTNVASTLEFATGIDESDVGIITGANSTSIVYLKDTGAYVVLDSAVSALTFADGRTFTPQDGYFFTGQTNTIFTPTTPSIVTNASGNVGYYAWSNTGKLVVRGAVSNSFLGGNIFAFDAAAADVAQLAPTMQSAIDPASLAQPVTFNFVTGMGDTTIVNYDPNKLVIELPTGVTAQDLWVSERGGDLELSVNSSSGKVNTLTISGFYSTIGGALQEKPLTIQFADGSSWNDQAIQQAIWQRSGNNTNPNEEMWIVSPSTQPIDLTNSSTGGYYQTVGIKNDGSNTLKLGTDIVNAAKGNDTFVVGTSTNQARIENFDPTRDVVQFAAGIDPSDIEVSQAYADAAHTTYSYSFSLRSTGAMLLTVTGIGLSPSDCDDAFVNFSNGVSWTSSDMIGTQSVATSNYYTDDNGFGSNDGLVIGQAIRDTVGDQSIAGSLGDDVIADGVGGDTINGGGGHDSLYGEVGNDTFVFGHGSGYDTIVASNDGAHLNTLAFTADVSAADVSVVRPNAGNDLELILNDSGEAVLLPNYLADTADQAVQSVTFTNGTTWTAADLDHMGHQGSTFSAFLKADDADESITGGAGNDTIVGDGNTDTLAAGSGNDLIESGDGTNTIIGGTGLDTIVGGWGSDLIVAGAGDAQIFGGLGEETYQFGMVFGHDTLIADNASDGTSSNTIRFDSGINADGVSFSLTSSGGLLITQDSNGDSILLPDHYVNGAAVADVDQIIFGDGSTVLMSQIDALLTASGGAPVHYVGGKVITAGPGDSLLTSDDGNDVLVAAGTGNDTLIGGAGTDRMVTGSGNDLLYAGTGTESYVFAPGFGQDSLEDASGAASNTVQFAAGISAADVSFMANGNLLISVAGSVGSDGDASTLEVGDFFANGQLTSDSEQFVFSDGSSISAAQVNQAFAASSTLYGTTVQVLSSGVVINAPTGTDTLTGDSGNDTLNAGSGSNVLQAGSGTDVLNAGSGPDTLIGGSGSDTLNGGSGLDVLEAGTGNDLLVGGTGDENYAFNMGFGQDSLTTATGAASNTIYMGAGISAADLSFVASGNNLIMSVAGSTDANGKASTLTIVNHFANGVPVADVGSIVFSDGSSLPMSQVNQQLSSSQPTSATMTTASVSSAPQTKLAVSGVRAPSALSEIDSSVSLRRQSSTTIPARKGTPEVASAESGAVVAPPATSGHAQAVSTNTMGSQPLQSSAPATAASRGAHQPPQSSIQAITATPEASPGAPKDRAINDANDPAQNSLGIGVAMGGAAGGVAPEELPAFGVSETYNSRGQAKALARTINAANDMVKALLASGSLHHLAGTGAESAGEIQLQDGSIWSLSTLDKTMAALTSIAATTGTAEPQASFGSADLAHAQLISAMASFSPAAFADTTLPPIASEAYAVAVAVQTH